MFDADILNQLYRYAYALCANEADAYDLLQNAIEKLLRRGHAPQSPGAYVRTMMRNAYIDQIRHQGRYPMEPIDEADLTAMDIDERSLEQTLITQDQLDHLWAYLTPVEREVLFLWVVDGLSMGQVAAHMDRPRGTILSLVHRMRKRINSLSPEMFQAMDGGA